MYVSASNVSKEVKDVESSVVKDEESSVVKDVESSVVKDVESCVVEVGVAHQVTVRIGV